MRCLVCQRDASASAAFCPACGARLSLVCARAQPGGERRQLTVMFGDLVGSTALSHRLDPEELSDRLR